MIMSVQSLTIYVAVIYASCAWTPATGKLGVRNMLNTVQRDVAFKAYQTHRTISLQSTLILSRLLTLNIRVREATWLCEVNRSKDLEDTFLDQKFEQPVYFGNSLHPAHVPEIGYESTEDLESQTRNHFAVFGPQIYTDESHLESKRLQVFSEGIDRPEHYPLAHVAGRDNSKTVAEGMVVRLFWARAHNEIAGNDRADELARWAALTKKTVADYGKFSLSQAKKSE
ncbi:hypothetical protein EVAR_48811_1 [Eumeta japonica]|uniref:Uncharacterized protein n=1 Tax=Eumeta variegata TaxID=151549 RepID=A0A4C1Y3A0_EUMVA|nr:hypothetical protein EVAR_48811_1 [Eumeta japonica]